MSTFELLEFLKLLKPDWAGISIFTPIPGTEIYNELREKNFIEEKPDFAKFSHQSPNSNFAFNMGVRKDFPALAKETIEYIQNYNGSLGNLIRDLECRRLIQKTASNLRIKALDRLELTGGLIMGFLIVCLVACVVRICMKNRRREYVFPQVVRQ